jgi:hypothetical protein
MSGRIAAERQSASARSESSLMRRVVLAQCDPAKRRAAQWLRSIDNQRLAEFGLTAEDIAVLRVGAPGE